MKFDILTLFPEMIDAVMQTSIIGRAQQAGLVSIPGDKYPRFYSGQAQPRG